MEKLKTIPVEKNLRLRLNEDYKILYADNEFLNFTGLSIENIIYQDFGEICMYGAESPLREIIIDLMNNNDESYFAIKGKTAETDTYYWGLVRAEKTMVNGNLRWIWTIKMFPQASVVYLEELLNKVFQIQNNAGKDYAVKYLIGFLEDKGMNYEEYILDILQTSKKKLRKYFKL